MKLRHNLYLRSLLAIATGIALGTGIHAANPT